MKKFFLISIIFFLLSIKLVAITGVAGGAAPFLRSGIGARALSLSGAFTAYTDDSTVTYWNPAASSYIGKIAVSSMFSWLTEDRKYNFFNVLFPSDFGTFAINFINFSIGEIEARQSDTQEHTIIEDVENAYFLTYGKELVRNLSGTSVALGANFKIIQTSIAKYNSTGFSFDIGVIINPFDFFSFGIIFQDFLGSIKWSTGTSEKIPFDMKIGVLLKISDELLKISLDTEKVEYEGLIIKSGLELGFFKMIFIRGGISYDIKSYEFNYTFGAGIKYKINNVIFQVDYAFKKEEFFTVFQPQHKLSVNIYL